DGRCYRKRRIASRATRSSITRPVVLISAIVSAGTRRRWREKRPARTESASGTFGAVPYMGHSTRPTTLPVLSATTNPAVEVRSAGSALTVGTYSAGARKYLDSSKDSVIPLYGFQTIRTRIAATAAVLA